MDDTIAAIVLAAGKGTRMKAPSDKNKVVMSIAGKPIISYTIKTLKSCGFATIVVVVGYASESVKAVLGDKVSYALQSNPQGTGDAIRCALPHLPPTVTTIVTMYGDDSAFYPQSLIDTLISTHRAKNSTITLVTLEKDDPSGLGRIVRDPKTQAVTKIVEEKNATAAEKALSEINTGLYCFNRDFLETAIASLKRNPISNEYYLTDVIEIAVGQNEPVEALKWPSTDIWFGVNTPDQLQAAATRMQAKMR